MRSRHLWLNEVCQREESDSFPFHIELAPGGDAMEIAHVLELWQGQKAAPVQGSGVFDMSVNFELPLVQRNIRSDAQIQNGKVVDLPLARGEPIDRANRRLFFACHFSG